MSDTIPNPINILINKGYEECLPTRRLVKAAEAELERMQAVEQSLRKIKHHLEGSQLITANLSDPKENAIYLALHETRAALKAVQE